MKVYGEYTQDQLDAQYNLRARHPDHPEHFARWSRASADARSSVPCQSDIRYGDGDKQSLDLFRATASSGPRPLLAFIHGGYWQAMDKSDFGFLAPSFTRKGITLAVLNYGLAPHATIHEIVDDVRAALIWLWRNAAGLGADPARLFVSGHSAGGHLTAMMLATDWAALGADLPRDLVKGGCSISGLYDLEPIRLCFLNEALAMTASDARRASPVHLSAPTAPLLLAVGGEETEEFHRQQAELVRAWRSDKLREIDMPGHDHFSIMGSLADEASPLHRAVVELVADTAE